MQKLWKFVVISLVIFSISFSLQQMGYVNRETSFTPMNSFSVLSKKLNDYKYYITIVNDQNFTDYGFPGSGTEEDPYRIENYTLELQEHYANGIVVINTTKHFIIQNCNLVADWSAIILENVALGTAVIQNNTCSRSEVGIGLIRSNNVRIINNTCKYNIMGIFLFYSNYSLVSENNCYENRHTGIYSEWSTFNRFEYNNCSDNSNVGIGLFFDTNATITNNTGSYCDSGVVLQTSGSKIEDNLFRFNAKYGCWLYGTDKSEFNNNSFSFNGAEGCIAEGVDLSNFTYNQFENNTSHGLYFDSYSSENIIHHNRFTSNFPTGFSQAYDGGTNNLWYDEETKEGNYWSDHSGRGKYEIEGKAHSEDPYPLDSDLTRINLYFLTFVLGFPIVAIIKLRKKRKSNL